MLVVVFSHESKTIVCNLSVKPSVICNSKYPQKGIKRNWDILSEVKKQTIQCSINSEVWNSGEEDNEYNI